MSLLTSILVRAARCTPKGARFIKALAAGTVSAEGLRDGMIRWHDYTPPSDEIVGGLLPWERQLADRAIHPGDRVLLIGSGTGRELIGLARRGHEIVGVDPADQATAIARRHVPPGAGVSFVRGFFEEADIQGTFDVVLFSHRCYGLLHGAPARIGALRKAASLLRPGGRIIISYLLTAEQDTVEMRLTRLAARLSRSDVPWAPGDTVYRIRNAPPYYAVEHSFTEPELEEEAAAAGLTVEPLPDAGCPVAVLRPAASTPRRP